MRKLFQLVGEVSIAGIDLVNKQMKTMDKEARKVQKSITTLGRNMEKTGKAMTKYITIPIAIAGAAVVKFGADFDKAMTSSLAIMGEVSDAMRKDMEGAARAVAKTTKFAATEAAEAYFFLASAGLSAAESIRALPLVAAFAQAGQFDLSLATDLLTDAQSALGLVVKDVAKNMENMVRVSDVLVKANTLANASVQQFSEALTNKAGAALRVLGKDLEEGIAVLAVYADQGVKGAEAGTQLNIVLRDLQKSAIKNKEAFRAANIAVFDQEGEMRNLADIVSDLENRLGKMSDEEKKVELMTLGFTEKSISATVALLGTSDAIKEYEEKLKSAGGITQTVSEKQLQNFWDQLGLVKSELIDVGLTIWQTLEPILTNKLIPALKEVATFIKNAADWFDNLNKASKETILLVIGLVAGFGPLLLILGKALIATKVLTTAILTMNAALLANPFVLAAVAITAIGAAIYYTVAAWEEWKESIAEDVAQKQTSALKKNLEEIIPLYNELALMGKQSMGEEKFAEVSKKVKELETNLADLGADMSFTGNFGKRALEAENILTDLELITDKLGETTDKTTDKIDDEADALLKAAKAAATAAKSKELTKKEIARLKELKEKREQFEEGWTEKLFSEIATRKQILEDEKIKQLELAGDSAQTRADIEQFYSIQFAKLKEEETKKLSDEIDERVKIRKKGADEIAKINLEIANLEKELADMDTERKRVGTEMAIAGVYELFSVIQGVFNNRILMIDQETAKQKQAIENSILSEEDKNEKFAALDEEAARKKKEILRKQALLEKAMALFSIGINTASAIMKGYAQLGPIGGTIAAVIIGLLSLAQTAVVLSKPLPMKKGALIKGRRGGIQAEIGEGTEDEIVLPMKTGVQALAEAMITKLKEIELPRMERPALAMAGGGTMTTGEGLRSGDTHIHIGTLIADESGLKELERRLNPFRISDEQRKGRLYHGSR